MARFIREFYLFCSTIDLYANMYLENYDYIIKEGVMLAIKLLLGILCVFLVFIGIGLLISIFKSDDKKKDKGLYEGLAVCIILFIFSYNYITN